MFEAAGVGVSRSHCGWGLACALSVEYLALGVWVGGLIVLVGAVIPAVFNTFGGQESGGFFLTKAFEGYNRLVVRRAHHSGLRDGISAVARHDHARQSAGENGCS